MRIADMFSCAGGASMGLHQAFPDAEIHGYDIRPQPRYPFIFHQQDALTVDLSGFDFVWASPPCQHYTSGRRQQRGIGDNPHPDLIAPVRSRLEEWGGPWIIENVLGAPVHTQVILCGEMFGLRVQRHRYFEANFMLLQPSHPKHQGTLGDYYIAVYGAKWRQSGASGDKGPIPIENRRIEAWREAMDIDWMTKAELSESIPPAYSRYLAQFIPLSLEAAA